MPHRVPTVDTETLRRWLESGRPISVVDIRPAVERADWSIPGSLHLDVYPALKAGHPEAFDALALPKGVPVVAVCAMGRTSLLATEVLRERGYDAFSLDGGMQGWSMAWNVANVPGPAGSADVLQVRRTGKGCLSYLIVANGEAVVIDPSLDPVVYLDLARARGARITSVLETHLHADHLSRAPLLAESAGATLRVPESQRAHFPHTPVCDGDAIEFGGTRLEALRTPGHTQESTSYRLEGWALFTGDTLFLNAVGRPDLEAGSGLAPEFARALHHSLARLKSLPDGLRVLPGHTSEPVAFDGVPITASLGEVRSRVALLSRSEQEFVEEILGRLPETPPNYQTILRFNEAGELPGGDLTELEAGANRCAVG